MKWYQVRSPFEEKLVSFVLLLFPEDGDNPILGLGKVSLGLRPQERRHPKIEGVSSAPIYGSQSIILLAPKTIKLENVTLILL
jgi:hypothetical protein